MSDWWPEFIKVLFVNLVYTGLHQTATLMVSILRAYSFILRFCLYFFKKTVLSWCFIKRRINIGLIHISVDIRNILLVVFTWWQLKVHDVARILHINGPSFKRVCVWLTRHFLQILAQMKVVLRVKWRFMIEWIIDRCLFPTERNIICRWTLFLFSIYLGNLLVVFEFHQFFLSVA